MEKAPFLWIFWKLFAIQIIGFALHWHWSITGKWIKFFAVCKNQQSLTKAVCFHFDCHSRIILLLSCFHDLLLFLFLEVLIHMGFSYLSVPGLATFHNSKFVTTKQNNTFKSILKKRKKSSHPQNCALRVLVHEVINFLCYEYWKNKQKYFYVY